MRYSQAISHSLRQTLNKLNAIDTSDTAKIRGDHMYELMKNYKTPKPPT